MADIEFKTVRSGVRPHRVAILIPLDGGPAEWLQVIDICSQVWGGGHFVVIPTDGSQIHEQFWRLLDIYDPDLFVRLRQVSPDSAVFQQISTKVNPFSPRSRRGVYKCSPIWPDNAPYPLVKLFRAVGSAVQNCRAPVVSAAPMVESLAYSYLGHFTAQTVKELISVGIEVRELSLDMEGPVQAWDLWDLAYQSCEANVVDCMGLPRAVVWANLGRYSDLSQDWNHIPVVLVVGESNADFCLFYSLSHMRPDVYWLPETIVEATPVNGPVPYDDVRVKALVHLNRHLEDVIDHGPDTRPVCLTSMSLNCDYLNGAIQRMETARVGKILDRPFQDLFVIQNDVGALLSYHYTAWELSSYLGSSHRSVAMQSGKSADYLDVRPKHLKWSGDRKPVWVSEVAIDGYQLPRRRAFNNAMRFDGVPVDARITSMGMAFDGVKPLVIEGSDQDIVLARPRIETLSPLAIVETLAAEAGYRAEVSEKGRYQEGTVTKFGGLDELVGEFHSPRWRVVERFLDSSVNQQGVYDQGVMIRDRRYLDAICIARLLGCESDSPPCLDMINHYLVTGILQRGFSLKCGNCRQTDWYAVGEVGEQFRCSRCGGAQHFAAEARWMYRLDELVYQFVKNNVQAHALTLAAAMKWTKRGSFLTVPAINIFNKGDRTPYAEIDLACIIDGQLVIGECKTSRSQTRVDKVTRDDKQQFAKYEDMATRLGAKILVVSTMANSWNEAAIRHFESMKGPLLRSGIELRILDGKGLELLQSADPA